VCGKPIEIAQLTTAAAEDQRNFDCVAVGAFEPGAFPPPSDSIWEEAMHSWLGLPEGMPRYPQGRPLAT
jgi:hypothetical protein